jgi:hypothetical protein
MEQNNMNEELHNLHHRVLDLETTTDVMGHRLKSVEIGGEFLIEKIETYVKTGKVPKNIGMHLIGHIEQIIRNSLP